MLQIYLYGPNESGFLDLFPGAAIQLESVTDIWDEDLTTGEYSLPQDFPWTDNNRRLTGFAERLKNNSTPVFYKCDVYDSGYPEIQGGKFIINEKSGNFTFTKGKFSATITGSKGLFGSRIKGKYLTDLSLGGKITWQDMDSRHFAEAVMRGAYPDYSFLQFAPVAIENFIQTDRPDYTTEFLAKDTVNNVIFSSIDWTFGRPKSTDPLAAAVPGDAEYADYRTVPFLRTKYILQKVFEEMNYRVSGDMFDDPAFNDLFTFNNFAIENYSPNFYDFNRSITLANHVPKILIIDWLKGLFQFFKIYPSFTGNSEVILRFRKDVKLQKRTLSLNGVCGQLFTSTFPEASENNGYTVKYDWDKDDYYSDRVKDLKDKTILPAVATIAGLLTVNPGRELTTDDIVLVLAENMYYQVADATSNPVKWDAFAENLNEYVSGEGERSVDIAMSTLCTYVEFSEEDALFHRKNYLGTRMAGSYINAKGVQVNSDCPNKIFFIRMVANTSGISSPISFNHNRDEQNKLINPFSLALQGDTGIVAVYHQFWEAVKSNAEMVKTDIDSNRKLQNDISTHNQFEIASCLFVISKIEKTIPANGRLEVELAVV